MKKSMKKQGFTLVEIMIVVAIIGLLAAIGIPSFQKARANSIAKSQINNTRLVVAAAEQYAMEAGMTSGNVTYAQYYDYLKGCTAADDSAFDVGATSFLAPSVGVGAGAADPTCY